jgi:enolase
MVLPTGATSFREAIRYGAETYHSLHALLKKKFGKTSTNVGDEGGFGAPQITDETHALEFITEAIRNAGLEGKIDIGLDAASSEFFDPKTKMYNMSMKAGKTDRVYTSD